MRRTEFVSEGSSSGLHSRFDHAEAKDTAPLSIEAFALEGLEGIPPCCLAYFSLSRTVLSSSVG